MRKWLRAVFWISVVLAAVLFCLRMTILSWWVIPTDDALHSASLAPSLAGGDLVLMLRRPPVFGDLVRCADPEQPGRYVVGRVLGEAGDVVELSGDEVLVNAKSSAQETRCSEPTFTLADPTSGSPVELYCSIEAISGQKHKRATYLHGRAQFKRKATVGEDHVYLVSDDRAFPMDSREYGALPKSSCQENIFFRVQSQKGLTDAASRFTFIQ